MASEANDTEAHELLLDLKSALAFRRREAAKKLGELPFSSERIIADLVEARDTDWDNETRMIAAAALASPVHQALIQQNPNLMAAFAANPAVHRQSVVQTPSLPSLSWKDTWVMAVTKPSVATYERIANDPGATRNRAYKWMFFALLTAFLAGTFIVIVRYLISVQRLDAIFQIIFSDVGLRTVVNALLYGVFAVIGLIIGAIVIHFGAKLVGGEGVYSKLLFAIAAYTCPISALTLIISGFPLLDSPIVRLVIGLYTFVLNVTAVRAVYQLGIGRAILATIVIPVIIGLLLACPLLFLRG